MSGDTEKPQDSEIHFIKTSRGGHLLLYQHNLYRIQCNKAGVSYWKCGVKPTEEICRARVVLRNGVVTKCQGEHNHPPDVQKLTRLTFYSKLKSRIESESSGSISKIYKEEVAKFAQTAEVASCLPFIKTAAHSMNRFRRKRAKKRDLSPQNNEDPTSNEEFIIPDIQTQCSESSDTQTSTSLRSDIVKQEIDETERKPCTFADLSFHSAFANNSETQQPSTSCTTHLESFKSNAPSGVQNDVLSSSTAPHDVNNVGISTNFCDNGDTFSSSPLLSNHQRISSHVAPENSTNQSQQRDEIAPPIVPKSSEPPSLYDSVRGNNEPAFPPRDRFDAFGEFVASKLRTLDPKSSVFVQTTLTNLIFQAELGMFLNKDEKSIPAANSIEEKSSIPSNKFVDLLKKENIQPEIPTRGVQPYLATYFNHHASNRNTQPRVSPAVPENLLGNHRVSPVPSNPGVSENMPRDVSSPIANKSPVLNNPGGVLRNELPTENSNPPGMSETMTRDPIASLQKPWTSIQSPLVRRSRDEFDAFGEFATSKLRNLDPLACTYIETTFANLVFEAELGRFLSAGERRIFANKTNDVLRSMPKDLSREKSWSNTPIIHQPPSDVPKESELDSLENIVSNLSKYPPQPRHTVFQPPTENAKEVPLELIQNLVSIYK